MVEPVPINILLEDTIIMLGKYKTAPVYNLETALLIKRLTRRLNAIRRQVN